MATTISYQNVGAANVIIATENAANISIAINYVPYIANIANAISAMAENVAFIASNVTAINANIAKISANTANTASYSDSTITYWSQLITQVTTIATQTTTVASKVSSIENMAFGDHGIHFRQPHQWSGGSSTFASSATAEGGEPQVTTITVTNVSE